MEDLPRDLEKAVGVPPLSRPRKRPNHWTLLFVGDQGRIIRIKGFKGLLFAWTISFAFFTAAAVVLFYLYQNQSKDYQKLQETLKLAQKQTKSLRNEKDILMARIVVAESKLAKGKKVASKQPKIKPPKKKTDTPPEPLPEKKEPIQPKPEIVAAVTPPEPIVTEPEPASPPVPAKTPVQKEIPEVVAVDDFFSLIEQGSNTLRIKYKIRNIDQRSNPVAGRTFIILKPKVEALDNWLILPSVPMNSGKPLRVAGGRSFSITRFKTIRFKAPYQNGSQPFTMATILIYATNGELLLEKSFPIETPEGEKSATG